GSYADIGDSNPVSLFTYAIQELSTRGIAYLHLIEPRATAEQLGLNTAGIPESAARLFRQAFKGPLIAAGGFGRESAAAAIEKGRPMLLLLAAILSLIPIFPSDSCSAPS